MNSSPGAANLWRTFINHKAPSAATCFMRGKVSRQISQVACRCTVFLEAMQLLRKASQFRLNCCGSSRFDGETTDATECQCAVRCKPKGQCCFRYAFETWSW